MERDLNKQGLGNAYELVWAPRSKAGRMAFVITVLGCWVIIALDFLAVRIPKIAVAAAIVIFALTALVQVALTLSAKSRTYTVADED